MKKLLLGLVAISAISAVVPAQAGEVRRPIQPAGDDVVIMDAEQTTIQTGNHNGSVQTTIQQNRVTREGDSAGNTGTVMRSRQTTDQLGNGNHSDQYVEQRNEIKRKR